MVIPAEELKKATKTLIGKAVTVDFKPSKQIGIVTDAYFEDNKIKYTAEVKIKPKNRLRAAINYDHIMVHTLKDITFIELSSLTKADGLE